MVAALMGEMPLPVRPYDPAIDRPKDMGFGGPSTELLQSNMTSQGDFVNIPSLWFMGSQGPFIAPDPMGLANSYELGTRETFPRFDSLVDAVLSAKMRSASGGAEQRPITDLSKSLLARPSIFGPGM